MGRVCGSRVLFCWLGKLQDFVHTVPGPWTETNLLACPTNFDRNVPPAVPQRIDPADADKPVEMPPRIRRGMESTLALFLG